MAYTDTFLEDVHPIDVVEAMAETQEWEFDRVGENQIAMAVEGAWRTYSITIAWCEYDRTLRLIATYDLEPPKTSYARLYELLNKINDQCWAGGFSFWSEQSLMTYRYSLLLPDEQYPSQSQIETIIAVAVRAAEQYYPAVQLVCWSEEDPGAAMQIAIAESYGRA